MIHKRVRIVTWLTASTLLRILFDVFCLQETCANFISVLYEQSPSCVRDIKTAPNRDVHMSDKANPTARQSSIDKHH